MIVSGDKGISLLDSGCWVHRSRLPVSMSYAVAAVTIHAYNVVSETLWTALSF